MTATLDSDDIMAKYGGGSSQPAPKQAARTPSPAGRVAEHVPLGTFTILALNLGLFVADHVLHLPGVTGLYLYHTNPQWFQFVTCTFCHASWSHLSNNIFFLYIFGKLVEEDEGVFGVWATYLVTGVGASIASYVLLPAGGGSGGPLGALFGAVSPQTVSLGASGAVFGLFAVSVLVKLSRGVHVWKLMESFILGQFVIQQVMSEVRMQAVKAGSMAGAGGVNHIAHLSGALLGVLLVFLVSKLPGADDK